MAKPAFNNANIKAKINEIKAMESSEQGSEIESIRHDLKSYIRNNFSLTNEQDKKLVRNVIKFVV